MKRPRPIFEDFVGTLEYIEVCRIVVAPDGKFSVPSEKDGKIAKISNRTRASLALLVTEFAERLRQGAESKRKKKKG